MREFKMRYGPYDLTIRTRASVDRPGTYEGWIEAVADRDAIPRVKRQIDKLARRIERARTKLDRLYGEAAQFCGEPDGKPCTIPGCQWCHHA